MAKNNTPAKGATKNNTTPTATNKPKGKATPPKGATVVPETTELSTPPEAVVVTKTGTKTATRDDIVALAKEFNRLLDLKINLVAAVPTDQIIAELEKQLTVLEPDDFRTDLEADRIVFTEKAKETFQTLGFTMPEAGTTPPAPPETGTETETGTTPPEAVVAKPAKRTAEQITADKAQKAADKAKAKALALANQTPKKTAYTRAHAFMEVLSGGATKKELTDKAAILYEAAGGKHNATSGDWYTTEYLKLLRIGGFVTVAEGVYRLVTVPAVTTEEPATV